MIEEGIWQANKRKKLKIATKKAKKVNWSRRMGAMQIDLRGKGAEMLLISNN